MKKLSLFIFISGVGLCYYLLPPIENRFGKLPRPTFGLFDSSTDNVHRLTTINPTPPKHLQIKQPAYDTVQLVTVMYDAATSPENDMASKKTLAAITDFLTVEPQLSVIVEESIHGGITNREAVDIFNQFLSFI